MAMNMLKYERVIYPPLTSHNSLRQPLEPGEQKVLDLFNRLLPPSWEIYIQPHLNGLRPDFVLLNPAVGIGVFEVKDWNLDAMHYFNQRDQYGYLKLWAEKDGKHFCIQNENPAMKVNLYKKEIFNLYCPRIQAHNGWAAITAGVIFPFAKTERVKALLGPFLKVHDTYQPVIGIEEISNGDLSRIYPDAERYRTVKSSLMSEERAQDLRGWLVEPDFAAAQRTPLELDRNQRNLTETRTTNGYRRIKGPAGSGKSLVLAGRAAKLANEGKSVLVATYNITLWHYLRDLIVRELDKSQYLRNIRLNHFHSWCKHACYDVGWGQRYEDLWKKGHSEESILNEGLPRLADEAIEQPGATQFDAILVDEGQDYRPLWWNALRKALKPDGEMVLVADATQDVYGTASAWTDDVMKGAGFRGNWARLNVSYRLPPDALNLARKYAETFLPEDKIDLPEPEQGNLNLYPCQLRWVQCDPESADIISCLETLSLMRQTGENGLANADITILTADMASGTRIVKRLSEHNVRVVNTFGEDNRRLKMGFYMGDARVKATTMHSFKGWETRILVVNVNNADDDKGLALVYASLTRLKRSTKGSWLTVVCSTPKLSQFGTLFPDFHNAENERPTSPEIPDIIAQLRNLRPHRR